MNKSIYVLFSILQKQTKFFFIYMKLMKQFKRIQLNIVQTKWWFIAWQRFVAFRVSFGAYLLFQ